MKDLLSLLDGKDQRQVNLTSYRTCNRNVTWCILIHYFLNVFVLLTCAIQIPTVNGTDFSLIFHWYLLHNVYPVTV